MQEGPFSDQNIKKDLVAPTINRHATYIRSRPCHAAVSHSLTRVNLTQSQERISVYAMQKREPYISTAVLYLFSASGWRESKKRVNERR